MDEAQKTLTFRQRLRIPTYLDPAEITTGKVSFDASRCDRCGICASACPVGAIFVPKGAASKGEAPRLAQGGPDVYLCFACCNCVSSCPSEAITVERRYMAHTYYNRLWKAPEMTRPRKY